MARKSGVYGGLLKCLPFKLFGGTLNSGQLGLNRMGDKVWGSKDLCLCVLLSAGMRDGFKSVCAFESPGLSCALWLSWGVSEPALCLSPE